MQGILVNISDHPTLPLKRKQEVFCFKPDWRGEGAVEVFLQLHHYQKNQDNSYGQEFSSPSINNYESKMVASNVRKVDPTDGMECSEHQVNQGTEEEPNFFTVYKRLDTQVVVENPIGQFSFFDYIIRTQPVLVGQMLTNFILVDDQIKGKWNK